MPAVVAAPSGPPGAMPCPGALVDGPLVGSVLRTMVVAPEDPRLVA